jgi:hypothetical protein
VRDHNIAHGAPALGAWFAERHVYLRSGSDSRYLVLSRSLQIGVTIAVALVLAGLVVAGYNAIASHLAAIEQQREIARLESVIQSSQSAAASREDVAGTAPRVDLPAAQPQIGELSAPIEQSDAARRPAEHAPAATREQAAMRVAELEQHLADAGEQAARLVAQLAAAETTAAAAVAQGSVQPAQAGSDDPTARALAQLKADDPEGRLQQLRRQLAHAATTVALLNQDLTAMQGALAAARARTASPTPENASELTRLREQLRHANERIRELEGLADVASPILAPTPAPPAPR